MVNNLVWCERYRPKTLDDCIIPERLMEFFKGMVERKEVSNFTAVGSPGIGKTTVAKALCQDLDYDFLLINASEDRNIDTVRTTIREYASTMSAFSPMKVIILDEADNLTPASMTALRGVIEEFAATCRFILTGNFGNRIIEPLISRCPLVDFTITKEERDGMVMAMCRRLKMILDDNNIEYDKEDIVSIVLKYFPDFRKTLNMAQRFSVSGKLSVKQVIALDESTIAELVQILKGKELGKMRKWVVDNQDNDGAMIRRSLYQKCFDYLEPDSIPEMILIINKFDYQEGFCADREINTVAMLTEMMAALRFKNV